jgi:hypothetical protein
LNTNLEITRISIYPKDDAFPVSINDICSTFPKLQTLHCDEIIMILNDQIDHQNLQEVYLTFCYIENEQLDLGYFPTSIKRMQLWFEEGLCVYESGSHELPALEYLSLMGLDLSQVVLPTMPNLLEAVIHFEDIPPEVMSPFTKRLVKTSPKLKKLFLRSDLHVYLDFIEYSRLESFTCFVVNDYQSVLCKDTLFPDSLKELDLSGMFWIESDGYSKPGFGLHNLSSLSLHNGSTLANNVFEQLALLESLKVGNEMREFTQSDWAKLFQNALNLTSIRAKNVYSLVDHLVHVKQLSKLSLVYEEKEIELNTMLIPNSVTELTLAGVRLDIAKEFQNLKKLSMGQVSNAGPLLQHCPNLEDLLLAQDVDIEFGTMEYPTVKHICTSIEIPLSQFPNLDFLNINPTHSLVSEKNPTKLKFKEFQISSSSSITTLNATNVKLKFLDAEFPRLEKIMFLDVELTNLDFLKHSFNLQHVVMAGKFTKTFLKKAEVFKSRIPYFYLNKTN